MQSIVDEVQLCCRVPGQAKGLLKLLACVKWQPYVWDGRINESEYGF